MKGEETFCDDYYIYSAIDELGSVVLLVNNDPDDLDEYIGLPKIIDGKLKWSIVSLYKPAYHYMSSMELTDAEKAHLTTAVEDSLGEIDKWFKYHCDGCDGIVSGNICPHKSRILPKHSPDYTKLPSFIPDGKEYCIIPA